MQAFRLPPVATGHQRAIRSVDARTIAPSAARQRRDLERCRSGRQRSGTGTSGDRRPPSSDDRRFVGSHPSQLDSRRPEIDVRLQNQLSSDTRKWRIASKPPTAVDLYEGNNVLIPAAR